MGEALFPADLLRRSPAERVAYFVGYTMGHPMLTGVLETVVRSVLRPMDSDAPIVLVMGPAGVGKTTLLRAVEREVTRRVIAELHGDPGRLPFVSIVAETPARGTFDWKEYCISGLEAMHEPLIGRKAAVTQSDPCMVGDGHDPLAINVRGAESILRRALAQALIHRTPTAFFVDEAQHLAVIAGARRLQHQMDYIKRLADRTRVPHVLIGNYGLCLLRNLSGQLGRRTEDVHFRRYDATRSQDVADFIDVVHTFQCHLPLPTLPDLVRDWEYLYVHSVGCIGLLKTWLTRGLERTLENGTMTLTLEDLTRTVPPPSKSKNVLNEALDGEARLAELEEGTDTSVAEAELRQLLRLEARPRPATSVPERPSLPPASKRLQRRPGERVPARDTVAPDSGSDQAELTG